MSETERVEAPVAAPKDDPEKLVLRGRPRPVIRFRRRLIIGISAIATAILIGLTWVALEPPSFRLAGNARGPELAAKAAPDGIAGAPASYAEVPQLGPPLPGDLGRRSSAGSENSRAQARLTNRRCPLKRRSIGSSASPSRPKRRARRRY